MSEFVQEFSIMRWPRPTKAVGHCKKILYFLEIY
jgi:hypothetical protein